MKNKFLILSIAIATALASCQKESEMTTDTSSVSFYVSTTIAETKAVSKVAWADEDKISVWAWAGATVVVNGITNECDIDADTETWTPASPMFWKDMTTDHNFMATYPVQTVTDFDAHSYTLSGNGAADDDFLVAVNEDSDLNATDCTTVPLAFEHMMSKVTISLSFRDQFTSTPEVSKVTITAKNNAEIDLMTPSTTATGDTTEFQIKETTANTEYEGVIVPQDIQYINITIGDDTYTYTHSEPFTLVQGLNHAISLTVGKDVIMVGTVTVGDWSDGDSITAGDAELVVTD